MSELKSCASEAEKLKEKNFFLIDGGNQNKNSEIQHVKNLNKLYHSILLIIII
jgi:hypothetical protein